MLQSSFTWDEIAFEHVQCVIDDTGFRFKATSGSETHHVKDEHSCHPSTFLVWEATDIPQCVGSSFFNCQAAISKAQGLIGSLEEGDILQLQFHHSVGIPVAQYVLTMAFDTIAGCHRCARPS